MDPKHLPEILGLLDSLVTEAQELTAGLTQIVDGDDGWRKAFYVESELYRNARGDDGLFLYPEYWAIVQSPDGRYRQEILHAFTSDDDISTWRGVVLEIDPEAVIVHKGQVNVYNGILGFTRPSPKSNVERQVLSQDEAQQRYVRFLRLSAYGDEARVNSAKDKVTGPLNDGSLEDIKRRIDDLRLEFLA